MIIGRVIKTIGCILFVLLIITEWYLIINGDTQLWFMINTITLVMFVMYIVAIDPDDINNWFYERREHRISKLLEDEYKKKAETIESFIEDYNSKRV